MGWLLCSNKRVLCFILYVWQVLTCSSLKKENLGQLGFYDKLSRWKIHTVMSIGTRWDGAYLSKVLGDRQALLQAIWAAGEGRGPQGAPPLQARVPFLGRGWVSQELLPPTVPWHWPLTLPCTWEDSAYPSSRSLPMEEPKEWFDTGIWEPGPPPLRPDSSPHLLMGDSKYIQNPPVPAKASIQTCLFD